MDEDLQGMSREELIAAVRALREGIRAHRDSSGQELCWHHPQLWGLLPEKQDPLPPYLPGQCSCRGAFATASRSIARLPMPRGQRLLSRAIQSLTRATAGRTSSRASFI